MSDRGWILEGAATPRKHVPALWTTVAELAPAQQMGFVVIVLTCLLIALRGGSPGSTLAGLLVRRPPPE